MRVALLREGIDKTVSVWISDSLLQYQTDVLPEGTDFSGDMLFHTPVPGVNVEDHPGFFSHAIFSSCPVPILNVFALIENNRALQRTAVWTSDNRFALRDLERNSNDRDFSWTEEDRFVAGNFFGGMALSGIGRDVTDVGSLRISRTPSVSTKMVSVEIVEIWALEVFVPNRTLFGIIPDALFLTYEFWRTSDSTIRGYVKSNAAINTSLLVTFESSDFSTAKIEKNCSDDSKLILISPFYNNDVQSLAQKLTVLDSFAYMLIWAHLSSDQKMRVDLIHFPRLNLHFYLQHGANGSQQLRCEEFADLYVCFNIPSWIYAHMGKIMHALLMTNEQGEFFLLIPSFPVVRPAVKESPLSVEYILDRKNSAWASKVASKNFLYPLHVSSTFLTVKNLASGFYLTYLYLLTRQYEKACTIVNQSCFSDSSFSDEEIFFLSMIKELEDKHPDARLVRIHLALNTTTENHIWDIYEDWNALLSCNSSTSQACRLSLAQEKEVLFLLPRNHEGISTRQKYLSVLESTDSTSIFSFPADASCCNSALLFPNLDESLSLKMGPFYYSSLISRSEELQSSILKVQSLISGPNALSIIDSFFSGHWNGNEIFLGFGFIYDMLVGGLSVSITNLPTPSYAPVSDYFHVNDVSRPMSNVKGVYSEAFYSEHGDIVAILKEIGPEMINLDLATGTHLDGIFSGKSGLDFFKKICEDVFHLDDKSTTPVNEVAQHKHLLNPHFFSNHSCNVCKEVPANGRYHSCLTCDYDECEFCFAKHHPSVEISSGRYRSNSSECWRLAKLLILVKMNAKQTHFPVVDEESTNSSKSVVPENRKIALEILIIILAKKKYTYLSERVQKIAALIEHPPQSGTCMQKNLPALRAMLGILSTLISAASTNSVNMFPLLPPIPLGNRVAGLRLELFSEQLQFAAEKYRKLGAWKIASQNNVLTFKQLDDTALLFSANCHSVTSLGNGDVYLHARDSFSEGVQCWKV